METKWPKNKAELETMIQSSHYRGYSQGGKDQKTIDEHDFKRRQSSIRLDALREIQRLASAYGQLMNTIVEAMKSEAGQL